MLWSEKISDDQEALPISIHRGAFIDLTRDGRDIPYKIYTPDLVEPRRCPVIVWSHGLGGSRDGAGFISRYVASYGYVIVHIQHRGTDSSLWEGKPGHPWDVIRATHIPRSATLARLRDVPFVLDQLPLLAPELTAMMDFDSIGMSGHSFGAMTTQVMAGQKRGYGRHLYDLFEDRFKCGIVYSPGTVYEKHGHEPQDFYGSMRLPLFFMTGTDDASPVVEGSTYKDRLEVFEYSGGPEQSLLILEGGDHMVYNGSRGKLQDNPKRDIHEKILRIASLAFWEAYLKGDAAAKTWLTGGDFAEWLGREGEYEFRK